MGDSEGVCSTGSPFISPFQEEINHYIRTLTDQLSR